VTARLHHASQQRGDMVARSARTAKAGRRCCDEIGDPKASKEGTRDGGNLCGTARAYYKRGGIAPGASIK
jgi:hypothetical protein